MAGGISLAEFHRRVIDGWPGSLGKPVGYEAVRTYHYDRDPPAAYLARVSAVFCASLDWLISGEGDRDSEEALSRQFSDVQKRYMAEDAVLYEHVPRYADLPWLAQYAIRQAVPKVALLASGAATAEIEIDPDTGDLEGAEDSVSAAWSQGAARIGSILQHALEALEAEDAPAYALGDFVVLVCQATTGLARHTSQEG